MYKARQKRDYRHGDAAIPEPAVRMSSGDQEHPILNLQRTIGNQAVLELLGIQAKRPKSSEKLTITAPRDLYEQEADLVAEQVMTAPLPELEGGCKCGGKCSKCQAKSAAEAIRLQAKAGSAGTLTGRAAPGIVHEVLRSSGRPLDAATRAFMEPRFGHDFSGVRVHADSQAADSAKAIHARAYTAGSDVVFADNQFSPATFEGQKLLAHELTHVVQQGAVAKAIQRSPDKDDDDDDEPAKPHAPRSCPGGAMPFQGVCMTDEVLEEMQKSDVDAETAEKNVRAREAAQGELEQRRARTIRKYANQEPSWRKRSYENAFKVMRKNPDWWKKNYDLETLQQIAEEQIPEQAAAHAQDVREKLSTPNWTAGEQVQMDDLRNDIKGWDPEEQELARYLLWQWFEMAHAGRSPLVAKKTIIMMTSDYLEKWLLAVDKMRAEDCDKNPPGFVEKLYRVHGIDRCKPWFDGDNRTDQWFHGPSELHHFRSKMMVYLGEDESPKSLVYECVKQYRRQTNVQEQMRQMQAAAITGMIVHVGNIGMLAAARPKGPVVPPKLEPPSPAKGAVSRASSKLASAVMRGLDEHRPGAPAGGGASLPRPPAIVASAPVAEPAPTPDPVRPAIKVPTTAVKPAAAQTPTAIPKPAPAPKVVKAPAAAPTPASTPKVPEAATAAPKPVTQPMKRTSTPRPTTSSTYRTVTTAKRSTPEVTTAPRSSEAFTPEASASVTPQTPAPTQAPRVTEHPPELVGQNYRPSGDTAGTSGIRRISANLDSSGSLSVRVDGDMRDSIPRRTAPNFNTTLPTGRQIGLTNYEIAHAYGPGFGDEARDGLMYAPREVNQGWQNQGVESRLRELYRLARQQGATIRVSVRVKSYPLNTWRGHHLLQDAGYHFEVALPSGETHTIGQVDIHVPPPTSAGRASGTPTVAVTGGSHEVWSLK